MKHLIIISTVTAAVLFFASCEEEDLKSDLENKVTGTGEIVTRNLTLDSFNEIHLEGVSNVYVTISDEQSTVLKAQQNIIDVMTWEVVAGTLLIGLEENTSIENHEEIRFEIEIPELHEIIHDGVGDFDLTGNTQETLDITHTGVGDIYGYALPVNECYLVTSGVGDCKVKVNDYLNVELTGVGNVYYRGNPEIEYTDMGVGQLIDDNN